MSGYENYTLSPVPWIKQMPEHWGLVRGKNLYQKMQRPTSDTDEVVTCFRDGTVTLRKNRRTTGFTESLKEIGYQGIRKGDLVIHVMDAFAGSIGVSDSDGKGTPVYSVCQAKGNSNNQYYALLLREMARSGYIQSLYRGIRERSSDFRFEVFAAQFYPVPPREEQDQIVRFLDWKVSSINKLINIKKKEIKDIDALKRSLINHAITHGLSADAPMKYSGVKWLGDIPAHWQIVKLRQILHPVSEKNHPELPLLSVVREQGVILRDVEDTESNHNYIPDDLSGYKVVRKGQFAMNKMKAWQGSYGISDYTGIVSPAYFIFDVAFENLEYFHYAIRSKVYVNFFAQASDGIRVGQWDLQMDMFGNINWNDADNVRRQILEIPAMVSKDEKYQNAMRNSDEQSARLESERALQQVIFSIMSDNMELFKQFQDNPSFKKWLSDMVFNLTYNKDGKPYENPDAASTE